MGHCRKCRHKFETVFEITLCWLDSASLSSRRVSQNGTIKSPYVACIPGQMCTHAAKKRILESFSLLVYI